MKRTINEIRKNIFNVHGNNVSLLNTDVKKYKEKLKLQCNICHQIFYVTYDNLVNKKSHCPHCLKRLKTNDSFIKELYGIYGNKLIYRNVHYVNALTPVQLICPKHGNFEKTPNKLLIGQGCPKCVCSNRRLENIVMAELLKNNFLFEAQKKFEWLGQQSLDFYLPEYNIAIECQGEQHFHQVYFNGKSQNIDKRNLFETIITRDEIKFKLCEQHEIEILYFISNKIAIDEINIIPIYNLNFYTDIEELMQRIKLKL